MGDKTPKCKYCRRPMLRKVLRPPEFRTTRTLMMCEYCDKITRRRGTWR